MLIFGYRDGQGDASRAGFVVVDNSGAGDSAAFIELVAPDTGESLFDNSPLALQTFQRQRTIRAAFEPAIGEAIFQFVKGPDVDSISISAYGFHRTCGLSGLAVGFSKASEFYDKYNTGKYAEPLQLTVGTAPVQRCFLVADSALFQQPQNHICQSSFQLVGIPV